MSLEALTSPQAIGGLSIGCFALLPFLQNSLKNEKIPFDVVKGLNICAYGVSFYCVTQQGKKDGKRKEAKPSDKAGAKQEASSEKKTKKAAAPIRVRTLLLPERFASLIWAPIYVGECLMVGTQLVIPDSSPMVPMIREISAPLALAQTFQTLWTASFSPRFADGIYKYVAAMNLSGVALSLSFCHSVYTKKDAPKYSLGVFLINFLPLTLHFGWTTVASLVNWNASASIEENVSSKAIAWVGHASAVLATALGITVTHKRQAPVYGAVLAWGLSAIASGVHKRIQESEKEEGPAESEQYGAKIQRNLCAAGAVGCLTAAVVTAVRRKR